MDSSYFLHTLCLFFSTENNGLAALVQLKLFNQVIKLRFDAHLFKSRGFSICQSPSDLFIVERLKKKGVLSPGVKMP